MKRFLVCALFLLALALPVVLTPTRADFSSPYSIGPRPATFAGLGTPNAGQVRFCSDCQATSPCTSGGTGAIATRLAGAWNCATGSAGTTLSDSASLRSALSDETGTGAAVFANTPTLVTPALGAATATSVTLGSDDAYDATSWNGSLAVPTKNAVRDKIESMGGGGSSHLVYTALLTQTGTSAPVATVLENTLGGTPTLGRSSAGTYTITLTGAFTADKTAVFLSGGASPIALVNGSRTDANTITFRAWNALDSGVEDDLISGASIRIEVYP